MADKLIPDGKVDQVVKDFREEFYLAAEYCDPHFELAARLQALWRGRKPWQLDGTLSKIMLNMGFGICQDRAPRYKRNMFNGDEFVSLASVHPRYDYGKDQAESWLRNLLKDESQINIMADIDPTLQSANVMGSGYRMPFARKTRDGRWQVSSRDIDFFQILPAPVGGRINPLSNFDHDDCLPYFFYVDWMTDEQIKNLSKYDGYNKGEARKCFDSNLENTSIIDDQYHEIFNIIGGVDYGTSKNDWRSKLNDTFRGRKGGKGRRRVVHWYTREHHYIIAQDSFLIFDGPPPMGEGILPLVHYKITNDFHNWFGIGSLEMIEDLIVAILMNFNYRIDHLGRVMFPTKWIRADIMGGRPESDFYDRPNAIHEFPMTVQRFHEAVVYDRAPEVSQQTFIEEDRLKYMLEAIGGSPDYSKALGSSGGIGNTATGFVSLVNQIGGRVEAETMMLEYSGLTQECRQLLILADKYINDEEFIRNPKSLNGTGWMAIDPDYLTDGYIVKTHGTKTTGDQEQAFQRLVALYPMWNQDPMIDPYELRLAMADASGVPNLTKAVLPPRTQAGMGGAAEEEVDELGGLAAPQNIDNRFRSQNERMTVNERAEQVPVNMAM
jgi:hypothetical protein